MKVKQCIYFVFQIGPGRFVTVDSTPRQHDGRPLPDTSMHLESSVLTKDS